MSTKDSKKRLRQAREATDGSVEVLCFACRRTADTTKQVGLAAFFMKPAVTGGDELPPSTMLRCAKCRRQMDKHQLAVRGGSGGAPSSSGSRVLPQIARLRQYQRLSTEQGMAFAMQESVATALMRLPCIACGALAPTEGHGLTRLRVWPDGLARPARGGFMGPFHLSNVAPCCGTCNLMKGYRRVRGFIEAARHIATHRASAASGEDYGLYPRRFRNNDLTCLTKLCLRLPTSREIFTLMKLKLGDFLPRAVRVPQCSAVCVCSASRLICMPPAHVLEIHSRDVTLDSVFEISNQGTRIVCKSRQSLPVLKHIVFPLGWISDDILYGVVSGLPRVASIHITRSPVRTP